MMKLELKKNPKEMTVQLRMMKDNLGLFDWKEANN